MPPHLDTRFQAQTGAVTSSQRA